jgi:hypothetical protein
MNPRSPEQWCTRFDTGLLLFADELQDVIDYYFKCEPAGCYATAMYADAVMIIGRHSPLTNLLGNPQPPGSIHAPLCAATTSALLHAHAAGSRQSGQ